jgi:hypothetical protein
VTPRRYADRVRPDRPWARWQPAARPDGPDGPDGPDRSRLVLALGIVSLVLAPLGLVAWAAGNACLRAIADGRMDPAGEPNARAGRMLGIIATGIMVTVKIPLVVGYLAVKLQG